MERQLMLDDFPSRPSKRRSNRRRATKRLRAQDKPGVLRSWMTQTMLQPFLLNAETWRWDQGSDIADRSGHNVEEGSAFRDNLTESGNLDLAILEARRKKLPAKDVIDALYSQTRQMAYRIDDQTGWTGTYFGYLVDKIIEVYPRDKKYGEELKKRALNRSLLV